MIITKVELAAVDNLLLFNFPIFTNFFNARRQFESRATQHTIIGSWVKLSLGPPVPALPLALFFQNEPFPPYERRLPLSYWALTSPLLSQFTFKV